MRITEISSKQNPQFQSWKDLLTSRGIREQGQFLLFGEKLIREFLQNPHMEVVGEIVSTHMQPVSGSQRTYRISDIMFDAIDEIGTHFNILILKLPEIPAWDFHHEPQGLEVIAPLGDPNNLGALTRSALAFGVKHIVLTQEACLPFLPRAIKASSGAVLKMNFSATKKLSELSHEVGLQKSTWALDMNGENLATFKWPRNMRLVLGEEGPGFSDSHFSQRLSIPMLAGTESLNATVAASIAIFEHSKNWEHSV